MWQVYWWSGDGTHSFRKLGDAIAYVRLFRHKGFTLSFKILGVTLWMRTFSEVSE